MKTNNSATFIQTIVVVPAITLITVVTIWLVACAPAINPTVVGLGFGYKF